MAKKEFVVYRWNGRWGARTDEVITSMQEWGLRPATRRELKEFDQLPERASTYPYIYELMALGDGILCEDGGECYSCIDVEEFIEDAQAPSGYRIENPPGVHNFFNSIWFPGKHFLAVREDG